jgi:D-serine deaminase-like pyridoxal phosphate-dependent protein
MARFGDREGLGISMNLNRKKLPRRGFLKKTTGVLAGLAAGGTALGYFVKPEDTGRPHTDYFSGVNETLRDAGIGLPVIIVDLDAIDHNVSRVKHYLTEPLNYRVVSKSLPSRELLSYVLDKAGTRRLMAFHQPFLEMLAGLDEKMDILLGKPLLVDSVEKFYQQVPGENKEKLSQQIQWLVDTNERLHHMLDLAKRHGISLLVNFEIDVGLHRGGAKNTKELDVMLRTIAANKIYLSFTGFMGYEAHVPHAPPIISSVEGAFIKAMNQYTTFFNYGRKKYPELFQGKLTFNSGGSSTYQMFPKGLPVNDIAAGSCMVKPSTFDILQDHKPALFIAAPVIKKIGGSQLPFLDFAADLIEWWDPAMQNSIYLYGGGWAADITSPPGIKLNGLTADPPNQNLLPNQSLYNGSNQIPIEVGDFVFFHPQQGDAISQFQEIIVLRDRKIIDTWKSFPIKF